MNDERYLDAHLNGEPDPSLDPATMDKWNESIDRLRAVAKEEDATPAADQRRLVQSILSRTTGEDLSWRGDLALYGRFFKERLKESPWLQLAAASLLVHLAALPALAFYQWWTEPEPRPLYFDFESPVDHQVPELPPELDQPLEVPGGDDLEEDLFDVDESGR